MDPALALIAAGYVLSGGILPNTHKGLSLVTYPAQHISPSTSESPSITVVQDPSFDPGSLSE